MEIVQTTQPTYLRLSEDFLAPYKKKGDPFTSLLARSTYLTKYCRGNVETWTQTIRRVVEGNVNLAYGVSIQEAELLFHLFWTGQVLPPGRGLWTGGVEGIPADARFNCWYTTLYSLDDWCWTANQLMLGGGVGVGLNHVESLPRVVEGQARFAVWCRSDHADFAEVKPEGPEFLNGSTPQYKAADSREGWVTSLRKVLTAAFENRDLVIDVSAIRPRGTPIKTFGGIACGPGPLVHMLRSAFEIVRGGAGRRLNSVECLDITNHIGLCIKSGNVRRSALITLGKTDDRPFRDAKKDTAAVMSHRHTSNNSLAFDSWDELESFDWRSLVEDNIKFGEPGIANMPLVWQTDPGAKGFNPCGEVALHDREACNLAEVFPAQFEAGTDPEVALRLATRYCLRQRLSPLTDPQADAVQKKNMRLGVGLGGLCDFDWTDEQLARWFSVCRREADEYADYLGVNRPISCTTIKPSGTISLLNGSSPGIHAPHAEYYIRRTRIAKNDPMAMAMMDAGVPFDEDVYDKTGKTWAFEFPMPAPHARVTCQNEDIRSQFERQARVQKWWSDNAVSATLNFDAEREADVLAGCLEEFAPRLKSTACLPKAHGYEQPPYEAISEADYDRLAGQVDHNHKLVNAGDIEVQGCASGVCPIR